MVPHRGTNWAALWLTAQIGRDAVLSKSYGRGYKTQLLLVLIALWPGHNIILERPWKPGVHQQQLINQSMCITKNTKGSDGSQKSFQNHHAREHPPKTRYSGHHLSRLEPTRSERGLAVKCSYCIEAEDACLYSRMNQCC